MSKFWENLLVLAIIVLLYWGVAYIGLIINNHIWIPVSALMIIVPVAFLCFKLPKLFGTRHHYKVLRIIFFLSIVISVSCFAFASKSEAYIEKVLFGGNILQREEEVEGPNGEQGLATEYYLRDVNPIVDNVIGGLFWLIMIGSPLVIYAIGEKVPKPQKRSRIYIEPID